MHPALMMIKRKLFALPIIGLLFLSLTAIIVMQIWRPKAVTAGGESDLPPTLVIDPGHGGADGGAVSVSGKKESEINLSIAQKFADLCRILGYRCVLTRSSERLAYPETADSIREKKAWDQERRAELIRETEHAVLISIHQNLYPDARPRGPQVLYGRKAGSAELAEITHRNLLNALYPESRRVAAPASDSIYLMRIAPSAAILAECGFLSNPEEEALLCSDPYQTGIAAILLASWTEYLKEYANSAVKA